MKRTLDRLERTLAAAHRNASVPTLDEEWSRDVMREVRSIGLKPRRFSLPDCFLAPVATATSLAVAALLIYTLSAGPGVGEINRFLTEAPDGVATAVIMGL